MLESEPRVVVPNLAQYGPNFSVRLDHQAQRRDWLQCLVNLALGQPLLKSASEPEENSHRMMDSRRGQTVAGNRTVAFLFNLHDKPLTLSAAISNVTAR